MQKWISLIKDAISSLKVQSGIVFIRTMTDLVSHKDQNLVNNSLKINTPISHYLETTCAISIGLGKTIP